jgi:hypothetical protein
MHFGLAPVSCIMSHSRWLAHCPDIVSPQTKIENSCKNCRQFYIDGRWVDPTVAHDLAVVNPATEEPVATISLGSAADVDKAVAAAKKAFPSFSETSVETRHRPAPPNH